MAFFTKRLDRRIAAYQQELLETHYREVENMYREMRGWRHDYRNHIQLLKMYAQNGDLDAIRAYLDALETDLTRVDTVVKTGNRMADAILNSKISLAKSKHIPVRGRRAHPRRARGLRPRPVRHPRQPVRQRDRGEPAPAGGGADDPRLHGHKGRPALHLVHEPRRRAGSRKRKTAASARRRRAGHGFGLFRIDSVVGRLGGYIRRASEAGAFTTEILLPLDGAQFVPEN